MPEMPESVASDDYQSQIWASVTASGRFSDEDSPNLALLCYWHAVAKAAGLLQPSGIDTSAVPAADKDPDGTYVTLANNYLCYIANGSVDASALTWDDLLKPEYKGKLQYSTPGQAGDGTASISREAQQAQAVAAILAFVQSAPSVR